MNLDTKTILNKKLNPWFHLTLIVVMCRIYFCLNMSDFCASHKSIHKYCFLCFLNNSGPLPNRGRS